MSLPGRLVDIGGVRVFVHEAAPTSGTSVMAPPVVLVHGWMLSHYSWRALIPHLTGAGHRVVAVDLPGYGESDRPARQPDFTALADALLGTLDVLELGRAQLVGHSMGAAVSLIAAARRPERVDRLGLIDAAVYGFEPTAESRAVLLPGLGLLLFRAALSRTMIRRSMLRDIYKDPSVVTDAWVDYVWERVNRPGGAEAAHANLEELAQPDHVLGAVRAVRAPALVVWGADDRLSPADHARRLSADLGGAPAHLIPYCGHSPAEERPEALAQVLLPFLGAAARTRAAQVAS